jgi:hypothetical protein
MKKPTALLSVVFTLPLLALAQSTGKTDAFQKANNGLNKVSNVIAVFQPYLLKARQIFYDAKQLGTDAKNSSRAMFKKNGTGNQNGNGYDTSQNVNYSYQDTSKGSAGATTNNSYNQNYNNSYNQNNNNNYGSSSQNGSNNYSSNSNPQNYLPDQSLPINNPASVNNDGTGNWGNQNNGLYGNCLDVMTGTVLGMGDASQAPTSVDLIFFAPADGQNTYYLMTPGFARNNGTASYMTEHVSDQVQQWSDVNESEVALTKLTIGQFNQIQNNGQIQSAVRNAQNYSGNYSSPEQKLDGKVFAVKVQMDNREVYALVAVIKQFGTSGSNGYLQIKIKTTGIDSGNGQVNANAYMR